jgi:hypothetical protein
LEDWFVEELGRLQAVLDYLIATHSDNDERHDDTPPTPSDSDD